MRFSIIIPTRDAEYFVGRAIESVLNLYFMDYAIIVVFDRCEDGTEKVVQKYWCIIRKRKNYRRLSVSSSV